MMKELLMNYKKRSMAVLLLLLGSTMMLWAQEMNEKYSMSTQMFLNEQAVKASQPSAPHRAPGITLPDKMRKQRRLIASPDTVGGVAYISCFIHLKDANDLGEVRALGVEIEETFDGLDFVTARVPVKQLEKLADIDNVTKIKVAQLMRPSTDKARELTNVDDLLTESADATALGITSKYDGTGVILGVIDCGIDFQHIAFKDKDGNSRIKRAYVYNGSSGTEYTSITSSSPTTDDYAEDHGTHTSSTAGGSSVIVSGSNVTVTDDHAAATYGGMAPGADLYLAGVKGLADTYLINALKKMVDYADNEGKPLVVSNSWGSGWGPRDGTGEWATLVGDYFGDSHPNRVILFAASNDAGHKNGSEGGGFFVKKSSVTSESPLGTIIRTDGDGGDYYSGLLASAWNASNTTKLNCKLHVLDSSGTILKSWTVTKDNTKVFEGLSDYYSGSIAVYIEQVNGKYHLAVSADDGIETETNGEYTLAIEVYPTSGSANINMWSGDWSFFTSHLTTAGHPWLAGTDDMCVSDEATIPNAISIGAYVSKKSWKASTGTTYTSSVYTEGDIAYFSSYATAIQSPTEQAYPWISAPGARLAAGVNHYHTTSVDSYSYYGSKYGNDLVVNNSSSPYAMMEGTSMATPVAAGIVALWLQASLDEHAAHKNLTVNDVKDIMWATAITDSYTTTGANATHFGKGKIDALAGIQYILGSSTAPAIKATPASIDFADKSPFATRSYTKTLTVKGFNLEGDITATLADANGVYTLSQTSITQSAAADGVDITITYAPTAAGTHNATITLTSSNATDVVVNVTATAKAATPTIIAEPEALTFKAKLNDPKTQTVEVLSEFLTGDVTVTLTDANGVFSVDKTSIAKADAEEGAEFNVTFSSATEGTYTGTVTLSSAGAENVVISLSATAKESASNPDTKNFELVTSTDDLEEGMRYVIACGSKATAAGALNSSKYFESEDVTLTKDIITIGNDVTVFVLEGNQTDGWTFKNESTNKYLYSTATKSLAYSNDAKTWTLSNGTAGVIMAYGTLGTMLYNVGSPRFTTYTSSPTASMIQANLYMESSAVIKKDVTMAFDPATAEATLGEEFTEPTLTTTPAGLAVTYSSSKTDVATVDPSTGKVTLVAAGETVITATFAGNDAYNEGSASYTLTISEPLTGDDFALISSASDFVEGDYIIVYDNGAMNTTISNNRLQYTEVTPKSNVITTDDATIIWHIKPSGDYYTIYNAKANKYAASNGSNNQAQLLASGTDDKSLWSVTTGNTFDFLNKSNSRYLRRNGDYGFACYASGTGGPLSLYKRGGSGGGDDPDPSKDYYRNADGKKGEALKTAMCGIIYNRTEQDYDDLWEAFKTTDVDSDGKIWDMYSNKKKYDPVSSGSSYSQEGDCYNREHSWPQSWFGSNTPMHTDLHHVYPSDGYVNGMRSNNPYGETDSPTYTSENGFSKLGPCSYPGYTGKVFEPNDEYKGDFARTYFYMVTCYEEKLPDWYTTYSSTEVSSVLDGNTYPGLSEWQLNMLMEWAQNDPVSEKEINRNNAVYGIQNNRNPFIDYPGLEEYIWGSMTTTAFSYDNYVQPVYKQPVTMSFDPATATATLGEDFTEPTLTTTPADLTVTYSSSKTDVATVDENTGKVTLVAAGTTVITATFAGNVDYNAGSASYTLTVSESSSQEEGTLLYEGLTGYSSDGDSGTELTTSSTYFDYNGWTTVSRVYPGGTSNAKEKGGCLKFGTGSATGKLETKSINLTGSGTLTFYLKKYGSDTGKLNLTVTGAKANKTQFTPSDTWSLCTVNLTEATGSVVITFATSSKRAYVDEITLTDGSTPIVKEDVTMSFDPETAEATIGESFTEPTLTTDPDDLTVTYSSSDESVATVDENTGKVTLVAAGETTITATFAGNDYYNENSASYTLTVSESTTPVVGSGKYEKVTDASTLKAGDKILIAYINEDEETQVVLSTTQNTNNRAAASITVNADGTLSPDDNAQVITLEKDGDNYLFNVGTDGYLYAASSSKNWLMTEKTADANAKAAISISEDDATIEFQGSNSRKYLRYNENSGSPIFSCYASTSTVVTLPQIYREVNTTPAVLIGDANGDGQVTITDAVAIVDYILGNEPENFNKAAANVSGDFDDEGEPIVNITDAVGVVDIILNQE